MTVSAWRMFDWLRDRRRRKILEAPFPPAWRALMEDNVGYLRLLTGPERTRLEELVQVFLAEKQLEGCGELRLTDEMRVTIAANACILLLGLNHDMYRRVQSVLVYPSTVVPPGRSPGVFEASAGVRDPGRPLLGEAHVRGPVILVWDAARRGSRDPRSGHNVVFHEFAHKLDMLDGEVDGTPPLHGSERLAHWAQVCTEAYQQLQAQRDEGTATFMDSYGSHSEPEFFAVATETFFERPRQLLREQPELYAVLADFYRQDPAERELAAT